ncbi:DUF6648 family protein [Peptoniphilus sp. oral taxon 386]|uniref:DUF6648 family protein n=1 Tax=Peptoniphilus sp. oral taxon 386 TaxID=652713 RepID=UPI0001DA9B4F|nr:DUF6648 family protein [Peptoniphilus sp. oral taxon 386]EFI42328.1 hypothetical protein HMPREF0629_00974 [Peptoniphilus sp. oral taxon 386 str. F0131]
MDSIRKKGLFEKFFEHRSFLIMQYTNGDITKREFLQYNYDYFLSINAKPFLKLDSYEKGMYNYQYYNGMAKYYRMLANEVRNTKKHAKYYNYYLNMGNKYYHEKDECVLSILKIQNFENINSYYIKCNSNSLKNNLYEIVLEDKKEAIFHSKAKWLLDVLRENEVFHDDVRISLIENYINEKY